MKQNQIVQEMVRRALAVLDVDHKASPPTNVQQRKLRDIFSKNPFGDYGDAMARVVEAITGYMPPSSPSGRPGLWRIIKNVNSPYQYGIVISCKVTTYSYAITPQTKSYMYWQPPNIITATTDEALSFINGILAKSNDAEVLTMVMALGHKMYTDEFMNALYDRSCEEIPCDEEIE